MLSVKVSTKHQIVVPSEARTALGILPGDRLEVLIGDREIVLRPRPRRPSDRLRGLWKDKPWTGDDPVARVRALRDEIDARVAEREELAGHGPQRPSTRRAR